MGKNATHRHLIFPEVTYMQTFVLIITLGIWEFFNKNNFNVKLYLEQKIERQICKIMF